ncbi:MAG: hypothetical protein KF884_02565 [Fimbriimonadaceae bacterium]|nr:hypothetical protein [Fimbriimonadaceae bacterium]QYK58979.1 MAG: hypothetical protein KF884_02565 [Fimbriimonadaceae bacterium]
MLALALLIASVAEDVRLSGSIEGSGGIVIKEPGTEPGWTKTSPKHSWKFDRLTEGWGLVGGSEALRFRVFSQGEESFSRETTRLLLRLWEFNRYVLGLDHSRQFHRQAVDVYLCREGPAGGEQLFTEDPETLNSNQAPSAVNTVFLYQVHPKLSRLELCRELAHEYGHATLLPVRVGLGREEWANGDAGERIYLTWLRRQIRDGALTPEDTGGATLAQLDSYWETSVQPLADRVALQGPDDASLSRTDDQAYEAFLALICWAVENLHERAFARSLALTTDPSPLGYRRALEEAASETEVTEIMVPSRLSGKEVWYPVGKGRLVGSKSVGVRGAWMRFKPGKGTRVFHRQD